MRELEIIIQDLDDEDVVISPEEGGEYIVIEITEGFEGPEGPQGPPGPPGDPGTGASSWPDLTSRPAYVQSASDTVLLFDDVNKAYRVGTPDNPVNTDAFTLSDTNEVAGSYNDIHYNAAELPTLTPPIGRSIDYIGEFSAFTDCILTIQLQPDLNYLVYVVTPIDVPDVSSLASKSMPVVTVAGTTYTVTASDFGKYVRFTSASSVTVTISPDIDLTSDYNIATFRQAGAGTVTFVAGAGVTINGSLTMNGQNSNLQIIQVAANEYDELGGITP